MAMAVAVKTSPPVTPFGRIDQLAIGILAGVSYVLGSFAIVGKLLPSLWWDRLGLPFTFLSATLLGVLLLLAASALVYGGLRLLGPHPEKGLKAGIFFGLFGVLLAVLLAKWASLWIEHWTLQDFFSPSVGIGLTAAVTLLLLVGTASIFLRPAVQRWLKVVEDQGWFSWTLYKRSQGQMVRRGTVFGLFVLTGCGVYTMIDHKTLEGASSDWQIPIPFTGKVRLKSEGDAGPFLREELADKLFVTVTQPGDSPLVSGQEVSWKAFHEAETNSRSANKTPPSGELVIDQYELHRFGESFRNNKVKITEPGDLPLKYVRGQVIDKSEFEKEKDKLKPEVRSASTAVAPDLPGGPVSYAGLTILPGVKFTLPLLLAALSLWLAFRLVNLPVFADFLIATEAEVNKVSWTSRRQLIQDTIVVLVTVVLTTLLLLAVDSVWFYLLSWDRISVLQVNKSQTTQEQKEKPW